MLGSDHAWGRKVHAAAKKPLELVLDAGKAEIADGRVELGDEVEVAVGPGLVARDGADDQERGDAEPPEVIPVGGEELDGFSSAHASIVWLGSNEWKRSG